MAEQNSPGYKLREIGLGVADLPIQAGTALFTGISLSDITTGQAVTWNGWGGGGFDLAEVSPGERAFAAGLMFIPIGRGGSLVDDFARAGMRSESSKIPLKLPAVDYDLVGTRFLGYTTPKGSVFLYPGLPRATQAHVLRHEGVHSFFTPKSGPLVGQRQNARLWGYQNSDLLRFTEEAIAETVGSRSLWQGLRHPLVNGYEINAARLLFEGITVGGGIFGAGYFGYQIGGGQ